MQLGVPVTRPPKPEPKKPERKKPGPKPVGRRPAIVAFKCHQAYRDHLGRIAESERLDIATIVDRALMAYALSNGYEPFPKR